jgi:hypothetical protein
MSFVHDQPEFSALITAVERETRVEAALVEKDYWITHSLWALHETKLASSWCVPGAVFNEGVCGAAVTAPPTLTGASFAAFVLNSANCEPEFPNELTFELSGTSTIPITSITLAIPGVIEPAAELGTAPIVESPFRETLGLCFNGPLSGDLIQTAVIDEAGRASGTLSFLVE